MFATEAATRSNVLCAVRYDGDSRYLWVYCLRSQQLFAERIENQYEQLHPSIADNYADWEPGEASPEEGFALKIGSA